jgi:hypothetical protein
MKLNELKAALARHPQASLRFILPTGETVPAHGHVTEVGRIDKRFMDCGGTLRTDTVCRLQTLVGEDYEHRLSARKLLAILNKAASVLETEDIDVDVEHELQFVSQFPVETIEQSDSEILLKLAERHTACLAQDKCGMPPKAAPLLLKPLPNFQQSNCCA